MRGMFGRRRGLDDILSSLDSTVNELDSFAVESATEINKQNEVIAVAEREVARLAGDVTRATKVASNIRSLLALGDS